MFVDFDGFGPEAGGYVSSAARVDLQCIRILSYR